jgi:hydrogenase/urease accessory protein HupE
VDPDSFLTFISLGFRHILPLGLDHILFIIALCLGSRSWRSVILQASVFTLAHTTSLGLAATGLISAPERLTEALIALSVVALALDAALLRKTPGRYRTLLVFAFGLLHGLGFATVIKGYLEGADFLTGLLGFNVGVELGQIVVIALTLIAGDAAGRLLARIGRADAIGPLVIRPAAILIALAGFQQLIVRAIGSL